MRVLISGAGIAGPTLAYFLAKTGARITLVERSNVFLAQGQNVDVHGAAITILKKMGLMGEVAKWNTTEKGTRLINPKGEPFAPFPVKKDAFSPSAEYEILRGDLAQILFDATKECQNIKYIFGTTITDVLKNDSESVVVELSNGETQEFDVAVAADGQWSKLRRLCFDPEAVGVDDKNMFVAYFTIPRIPSDDEWWNVFISLGSRIITTRPDPHGTLRAMFTLVPRTAAKKKEWQEASRSDRKTQQDLLRREFDNAGWQSQRLLDAMGQSPDFYFHALQQIKMPEWSNSRVVCVGDAAYAPTPLTGMGTPLAIIGAYLVAGELSKLRHDEHPSKAFKAYDNEFRSFVADIQKISPLVPGIAHPRKAWSRWILQQCVAGLSKIASLPWFANKYGEGEPEQDDHGFKLPYFPAFDDEAS